MTTASTVRHRILLVGPGSVGTAVARLLADDGHEVVGVGPPDRRSATLAAEVLGAPIVDYDSLPAADLVLIGTPEPAIESVARRLSGVVSPEAIVCHFAGAVGTEPLAPLSLEVGRAALHPVQTCPDVDTAIARLPGSAWGVTCSAELLPWSKALISESLRGRPVVVEAWARPVWHAASVTTANAISALLATGESMLSAIGVAAPNEVLGPIATAAVTNAREQGSGAATLTGPFVRGEVDAIRAHITGLSKLPQGLDSSYRMVARTIIDAARRSRRIDEATAARIVGLLDEE
jgi:predicted short-subunit dehydrogenase-like oxidoreductase (DUF2520 family)